MTRDVGDRTATRNGGGGAVVFGGLQVDVCLFFFGGEKMKMRFLCGQKSDKTKLR